MHALVVHVDVMELAEAKRGLEEQIIPMQKQSAGIQVAPISSTSVAAMQCSSRSSRPKSRPKRERRPRGPRRPGVTLKSVQFGEVIASA